MSTEVFTNASIAIFIARVFLGMLFFFQGVDAVFRIGLKGVIEAAAQPLAGKGIPKFLIAGGSYFTSYVQLIAGLMLITGIFKYYALYLLGFDLLLASAFFGIVNPMWDMKFVFPRLVLLLLLLLLPGQWDTLSADALWFPHHIPTPTQF